MQCKYSVILWRVRVTTVVVEKQQCIVSVYILVKDDLWQSNIARKQVLM